MGRKDAQLVIIKFTKDTKEIDVFTANDTVKEIIMKNEVKLAQYIDAIKQLIPDKLSNKWVKIMVYLFLDREENAGVYTKIKYNLLLGKYLSSACSMLIDKLNDYFLSVVKVTMQQLDAKKLEIVQDDIL